MKKLLLLFFGILLISNISTAQKISLDQFKNLKPRNIGPAGMSVRITAIDAVVANPNICYVVAA